MPIIDNERDEYQLLGSMPSIVLAGLWPGFAPQDLDVFLNPVLLRRHMHKSADFVNRVAALNQYSERIAVCLDEPYVFARHESVPSGEAGITVYVETGDEPTTYLAVGIRILAPKDGLGKKNHVTTLIPPMSGKKLTGKLQKQMLCWPDGRLQNVKSFP